VADWTPSRARYERAGRNVYAFVTNYRAIADGAFNAYLAIPGLGAQARVDFTRARETYDSIVASVAADYNSARALWADALRLYNGANGNATVLANVHTITERAARVLESAEQTALLVTRELHRMLASQTTGVRVLSWLNERSWGRAFVAVATGVGTTFEVAGDVGAGLAAAAGAAFRALPLLLLLGVGFYFRNEIGAGLKSLGKAAA